MLVCPLLVVALGALWPLDWTHTKLDSLSPVIGHYHGTTWAMAEKVTQGDDTEEVVVVEGTTSDEVAKNKESQKGWKEKLSEWSAGYIILDKDGKLKWDMNPFIVVVIVAIGLMTGVGPVAIVVIVVVYFIVSICKWIINPKSWFGSSGSSLKKLNAKNVD
ncbi:putative integral membrane protein [Babesia bovis T2Bo]|uniref:Membrane protein, putative n=1 Tax=Babesia bovis TaxID=5865 RepID=A7ASQ5_BABBO|nr:putative integral membrane protein [Babesia bovis T2Bo]EDO05966.1 putative integral membrane protein [Babesia bovis T2Bo]|eukprot:XP_001609534.1 membrane protein [Babesia bovis T2Bo]